jgi:nitrogen fixation/metabolism regulation signal transduction histidine kinase
MRIKLSKSDWEQIGKSNGWNKSAQEIPDGNIKTFKNIEELVQEIERMKGKFNSMASSLSSKVSNLEGNDKEDIGNYTLYNFYQVSKAFAELVDQMTATERIVDELMNDPRKR